MLSLRAGRTLLSPSYSPLRAALGRAPSPSLSISHMPHAVRMLSTETRSLLTRLQIDPDAPNPGVYHGKWAGAGPVVESTNPSTGEVIAKVQEASAEDLQAAILRSRNAYLQWRNVPAPRRGEILRLIRVALNDKIQDLGDLVSLEMGKIRTEGKGEVQEFVDILDSAVGLARSIGGINVPSERAGHSLMHVPNPLGLVGVISAFNFPVAVFGWNFSLSFVAGNATLWKPAPSTPLCAIATTRIIADVLEKNELPGALASLVCGGGEIGKTLVADKRVDLLSFTGSEAVGRLVGMEVAGRFGQSILELGGNNAAVVLPDANIPVALRTVLFSALGTAGQRCTTTRRLFLHKSIAEDFIASLVSAYKSASERLGDPLVPSTLIGPLHSANAVEQYEAAVRQAREEGAEVLVGGRRHQPDAALQGGNWVEPTIIRVQDPAKSTVMQKETFAPILYVSTFETLEEAIELNNSVPQGLSSSLFTNDLSNTFKWLGPAGSDCGIVNVNGSTSGAEIGLPFGGNKSTGWGREAGGDSWKSYCRWSSSTVNFSNELAFAQGVNFE